MFQRKKNLFDRLVCSVIAFTFMFSMVVPPAQAQTVLNLPVPGTMVMTTPGFTPPMIYGVTIHPDNPLLFDFIVGRGDSGMDDEQLKVESDKLIKYFLASLTVPEDQLWVNLSPYEKDRIISDSFGQTTMGRDLLAQDYLLKQLSASLMYPEEELGSEFWDRVYTKAYELYGTTEIPMNTFNKIWVVPEDAVVLEKGNSAYVVDSHLKVMLEEDYVALEKNMEHRTENIENSKSQVLSSKFDEKVISGVQSEVIREVLIPEIEREVNEGETFANLRQIYNSVILAAWYKVNLKDSLLGKVYVDQGKTKGVNIEDTQVNQKIYRQYLEAFSKGVYNYIREDIDQATNEMIPRKYFSGGNTFSGVLPIVSAHTVSIRPDGRVDPKQSWLIPNYKLNDLVAAIQKGDGAISVETALAENPLAGTVAGNLLLAKDQQAEELIEQPVLKAAASPVKYSKNGVGVSVESVEEGYNVKVGAFEGREWIGGMNRLMTNRNFTSDEHLAGVIVTELDRQNITLDNYLSETDELLKVINKGVIAVASAPIRGAGMDIEELGLRITAERTEAPNNYFIHIEGRASHGGVYYVSSLYLDDPQSVVEEVAFQIRKRHEQETIPEIVDNIPGIEPQKRGAAASPITYRTVEINEEQDDDLVDRLRDEKIVPINHKRISAEDWTYYEREINYYLDQIEKGNENAKAQLMQLLDVTGQIVEEKIRNAPVEAHWPILKAAALLKKERRDLLLGVLEERIQDDNRRVDLFRSNIGDAIRLMFDLIDQDWLVNNAEELVGTVIYTFSAENTLIAGGLGYVQQVHERFMRELGATVVSIETIYQNVKKTDGSGLEKMGLPGYIKKYGLKENTLKVLGTKTVNLDGEETNVRIWQGEKINGQIGLFIEELEEGEPLEIEEGVIPSGGKNVKYTNVIYDYNKYGNRSDIEYLAFYAQTGKAAFEIAEKARKKVEGDQWQPAVAWGNDSQTSGLMALLVEALDEASEDSIFKDIFLSFTTHTFANRLYVGLHDQEWLLGRLLGLGQKWWRASVRDGKMDMASLAVRLTDYSMGTTHTVSRKHDLVLKRDKVDFPEVITTATSNGDELSRTRTWIRKIFNETYGGELDDVGDLTWEQAKGVTQQAGSDFVESFKGIQEIDIDTTKPTLGFAGRLVLIKVSPYRMFTPNNIHRFIKDGKNVVLLTRVQGYYESKDLAKIYSELSQQIEQDKRDDPEGTQDWGSFVFTEWYEDDQKQLMMIMSHILALDSDDETGTNEWTEVNGAAALSWILASPWKLRVNENKTILGEGTLAESNELGVNLIIPRVSEKLVKRAVEIARKKQMSYDYSFTDEEHRVLTEVADIYYETIKKNLDEVNDPARQESFFNGAIKSGQMSQISNGTNTAAAYLRLQSDGIKLRRETSEYIDQVVRGFVKKVSWTHTRSQLSGLVQRLLFGKEKEKNQFIFNEANVKGEDFHIQKVDGKYPWLKDLYENDPYNSGLVNMLRSKKIINEVAFDGAGALEHLQRGHYLNYLRGMLEGVPGAVDLINYLHQLEERTDIGWYKKDRIFTQFLTVLVRELGDVNKELNVRGQGIKRDIYSSRASSPIKAASSPALKLTGKLPNVLALKASGGENVDQKIVEEIVQWIFREGSIDSLRQVHLPVLPDGQTNPNQALIENILSNQFGMEEANAGQNERAFKVYFRSAAFNAWLLSLLKTGLSIESRKNFTQKLKDFRVSNYVLNKIWEQERGVSPLLEQVRNAADAFKRQRKYVSVNDQTIFEWFVPLSEGTVPMTLLVWADAETKNFSFAQSVGKLAGKIASAAPGKKERENRLKLIGNILEYLEINVNDFQEPKTIEAFAGFVSQLNYRTTLDSDRKTATGAMRLLESERGPYKFSLGHNRWAENNIDVTLSFFNSEDPDSRVQDIDAENVKAVIINEATGERVAVSDIERKEGNMSYFMDFENLPFEEANYRFALVDRFGRSIVGGNNNETASSAITDAEKQKNLDLALKKQKALDSDDQDSLDLIEIERELPIVRNAQEGIAIFQILRLLNQSHNFIGQFYPDDAEIREKLEEALEEAVLDDVLKEVADDELEGETEEELRETLDEALSRVMDEELRKVEERAIEKAHAEIKRRIEKLKRATPKRVQAYLNEYDAEVFSYPQVSSSPVQPAYIDGVQSLKDRLKGVFNTYSTSLSSDDRESIDGDIKGAKLSPKDLLAASVRLYTALQQEGIAQPLDGLSRINYELGVLQIQEATMDESAASPLGEQLTTSNQQREVGGIDLNPALLDLQIKRDGNGVPFPVWDQPIETMHIEGFLPVIINVTPVTNLPVLLGLLETEEDDLAKTFQLSPLEKKVTRFELVA